MEKLAEIRATLERQLRLERDYRGLHHMSFRTKEAKRAEARWSGARKMIRHTRRALALLDELEKAR